MSVASVADPMLAADAAAANGSHENGDVAVPVAVAATSVAERPPASKSTRSSKPKKPRPARAATTPKDTEATAPVDTVVAEPDVGDTVVAEPEPDPVVDEKPPAETPSSGVPMVALGPPVASPSRADSTTATAVGAATLATAVVTAPTAAEAVVETSPATAPTEPVKAPKQPKPPKEKPAPAAAKPRRKVRSRRVQRIVRRVDAWSVLKISFVFFIVMYLVLLVAGVLLWAFAVGTGTIDNVENFIEQLFALDSFSFVGEQILRASAIGGALLVVAGTFATTVLAVLFNLISDLVGGLRFTVIEEQILRPVSPAAAAAHKDTTPPATVDASPPAPGTV
jgi:Transmembrane domain of unknown function (DUF3566)